MVLPRPYFTSHNSISFDANAGINIFSSSCNLNLAENIYNGLHYRYVGSSRQFLGEAVFVRGIVLNAKIATVNIFYMSAGNLSNTICCTQQLNMKYIINHFGSCRFFELFRPFSCTFFNIFFCRFFGSSNVHSFSYACILFLFISVFIFFLLVGQLSLNFVVEKGLFPFCSSHCLDFDYLEYSDMRHAFIGSQKQFRWNWSHPYEFSSIGLYSVIHLGHHFLYRMKRTTKKAFNWKEIQLAHFFLTQPF